MNTVVGRFKDTVEKFPDNIAVEDAKGRISYRELDELTDALAGGLLDRLPANARNVPVLVYLPKEMPAVASFLAVLKVGCPYVPVDFQVPLQRLAAMTAKLRPALIIADSEGAERLSDSGLNWGAEICLYSSLAAAEARPHLQAERLEGVIDTDPAYIMHTSGSTGEPKGVVVSHRGIEDYADWLIEEFGVDETSVFGLQSGFHFDNCVLDMYGSFFTGGKMVIIPEVLFMYPTKLIPFMNEKKINTVFWVPTVMISVANSGVFEETVPKYLRTVLFAGEVMPAKQLNIWRRALPHCLYANLYGPTEITVDCLFYVVDREFADSDPIPIGRDCPNTRVLILREDGGLAGEGEEGEICVLGCGVGLGYWNEPELTEKAFVQNPLNRKYRELMYRTGDIGYRTAEGLVMYLGRKDNQFKFRGNRIELGEIEQNALLVPGVERACAVFDPEAQEIVLFVQSEADLSLRKFNLELKKYVPKYMLPGRLIVVADFPYNQNNKIDRGALKKIYLSKEK